MQESHGFSASTQMEWPSLNAALFLMWIMKRTEFHKRVLIKSRF